MNTMRFPVGGELLDGWFTEPCIDSPCELSRVMFLHGAGKATKERSLPLAEAFASAGIGSFAFDFSGHGQSSGSLAGSSLTKRLQEAREALNVGHVGHDFSLCAFSMGAHVAVQMLQYCSPKALILFYPAFYSRSVEHLPFGDEAFTLGLRRPQSWKDSTCFDLLRSYHGSLLVVIGGQDQVIPEDVIMQLDNAATSTTRKMIWRIPEGPHLLLPYITERQALFTRICGVARDMILFS